MQKTNWKATLLGLALCCRENFKRMTATGSCSQSVFPAAAAAAAAWWSQLRGSQSRGCRPTAPPLKQSTAYKSSFPQFLHFQLWGHVGFWTLFSHHGKTQTGGARPSLQTLTTEPLTGQMSWCSLSTDLLFPVQLVIKIIEQRTSWLPCWPTEEQNTLIGCITRDYGRHVSLISRHRCVIVKTTGRVQMSSVAVFFFQEHMKYVFIIVLFPLLVEIIPVPRVFDEEAQSNNKARKRVGLWNALKRLLKPLRVHLHQWRAAPLENTSMWASTEHDVSEPIHWGPGRVGKLTKPNKCKSLLMCSSLSSATVWPIQPVDYE